MSTDRDATRIVRSWLEEGVTTLPDRVLDVVLDQIPATPQRRSWWPARRFIHMNSVARAAIAAAAVIVASVAAIRLLPGADVGTTTPTPTPITTPIASPTVPPELSAGLIAPGVYTFSNPNFTNSPFTLTIPAGWTFDANGFIEKGDWGATGVMLTTWTISHVFNDSCRDRTLVEAGTRDTLVAALAAQTGHDTSGPTEVTIGGIPATRFGFSLAADFDVATCDDEMVRLWPDPGPDLNGGFVMNRGNTITIDVVESVGKITVLISVRNTDTTAADVAALQAVMDSIEFLP